MNCISGLLTTASILYTMEFLSVSNVNTFIVPPSPAVFRGGSEKEQTFFKLIIVLELSLPYSSALVLIYFNT